MQDKKAEKPPRCFKGNCLSQQDTEAESQVALRLNWECSSRKCSLFLCALANLECKGCHGNIPLFFFVRSVTWDPCTFWKPLLIVPMLHSVWGLCWYLERWGTASLGIKGVRVHFPFSPKETAFLIITCIFWVCVCGGVVSALAARMNQPAFVNPSVSPQLGSRGHWCLSLLAGGQSKGWALPSQFLQKSPPAGATWHPLGMGDQDLLEPSAISFIATMMGTLTGMGPWHKICVNGAGSWLPDKEAFLIPKTKLSQKSNQGASHREKL